MNTDHVRIRFRDECFSGIEANIIGYQGYEKSDQQQPSTNIIARTYGVVIFDKEPLEAGVTQLQLSNTSVASRAIE